MPDVRHRRLSVETQAHALDIAPAARIEGGPITIQKGIVHSRKGGISHPNGGQDFLPVALANGAEGITCIKGIP